MILTASTTAPSADDIIELRRVLYGCHAILERHFAQEEETYLSLAQEPCPDHRHDS
jgi:hypothetical protein